MSATPRRTALHPFHTRQKFQITSSRRIFILTLTATGAAACASGAFGQAQLDEKEPQAVALGYVADSARADTKKSPKHDNAQLCNGCALWQSKPTDPKSSCALFSGKQVNARGCSAWAKKA
ncbi:high-potential iron-sulfur protein [Variovorax sp. UC122_21]|uniref:high-potential iron-sulfur protein n=1 Tax=Variovorax TaxID=34072 RepID=UPI001933AA21|nr:high-potential iron-sulfur protein [Variovorax paradoxus]